MNRVRLGKNEIRLLEGERLDSTLSLRHGLGREVRDDDREVVLLTNRRVFQFSGGGETKEMAVAELKEVQAASMKWGARKTSTLAWGIAGILGGLVLYRVVLSSFDNTALAVALSLLSVVLGIYLIFDFWSSHEQVVVTFKAGGSEIRGRIHGKSAWAYGNAFLNRFFELKDSDLKTVATPEEATPAQPEAKVEEGLTKAPQAEVPAPVVIAEQAPPVVEIVNQQADNPLASGAEAVTGSGSESRPGPSQSEAPPSEGGSQQLRS